jgi:hypothetical protein
MFLFFGVKRCFCVDKTTKSQGQKSEATNEQLDAHEETIRRGKNYKHELQTSHYTEKLLRRFQGHGRLDFCQLLTRREKAFFHSQ